jgi:hypothetical protein
MLFNKLKDNGEVEIDVTEKVIGYQLLMTLLFNP